MEDNIESAFTNNVNACFINIGRRIVLDKSIHELYADANYPRLKKISDNEYILFYQQGRLGGTIYYTKSKDLKSWEAPRILLEGHDIGSETHPGDRRLYTTCDAVVLPDGEILAFTSYRASMGYRTEPEQCGIVMLRSIDRGTSWSEPRTVYVGQNWEPYAVRLSTGEIHVLFTHIAPGIYENGFTSLLCSGTGLIRSYDNGDTWHPDVTGTPYLAQRIMQSYLKGVNGKPYTTDQMACEIELADGSLAVVTESKNNDEKTFGISAAYSNDNWSVTLKEYEIGPSDRQTKMFPGAAPYLVLLPSGSTVLSYNLFGCFLLRKGDSRARSFGEPFSVFPDIKGCWGSLEVLGNNIIAAVFPQITSDKNNSIVIGCIEVRS